MNRVGDSLLHVGANEELVRRFTITGVEFIVVGGLAVSWYCAERQADDMDLLVNPTPENSLRIANALSALRLTGYADDSFAKPNLQVQLKQVYYAELLTPQTGGPTYEEVAATSISAKLFYIAVRVASPGMLIALKRRAVAAGQVSAEKHMRDIEMLEAHVA